MFTTALFFVQNGTLKSPAFFGGAMPPGTRGSASGVAQSCTGY